MVNLRFMHTNEASEPVEASRQSLEIFRREPSGRASDSGKILLAACLVSAVICIVFLKEDLRREREEGKEERERD